MKKEAIYVVLFLFLVSLVNAQPADSPWPTFHGNNQRTGLREYDTSHVDGTVKFENLQVW